MRTFKVTLRKHNPRAGLLVFLGEPLKVIYVRALDKEHVEELIGDTGLMVDIVPMAIYANAEDIRHTIKGLEGI